MPGKIIGEGIIHDITDDSEQDTCDGGTMTVLPTGPTGITPTKLCGNIMETLEDDEKDYDDSNVAVVSKRKISMNLKKPKGENHNKNIHDKLIRMSGVFSSFIVDANFSRDFDPQKAYEEDDEEDDEQGDENEDNEEGQNNYILPRTHPKPTVKESRIRLRRKYCGDPMQAMKLYRTHVEKRLPESKLIDNPLPSSEGTLLPGFFCAGNGSNILVSTMDLRSRLFEGDSMYIGDLLCVVENVSSARIEIKCPTEIGGYYISRYTGCNLQGWRKKEDLINDLSRSILQCTDMDCIRRIQALQCAHYKEHGHPAKTKKDLPKFCEKQTSIRIYITYTDGRKLEYKLSLKTDKLAKIFNIVVKEEQVDSPKDVKVINLRTNVFLDSSQNSKILDHVKGIANDDIFMVIKNTRKKGDKWGFFTRM